MKNYYLIPSPKKLIRAEGCVLITGFDCPFDDIDELMRGRVKAQFAAAVDNINRIFNVKLNGVRNIRCVPDGCISEGYTIDITPDGVTVGFCVDNSLSYALSAIAQLAFCENGQLYLPCCHIEDAADRCYRGLMVDLARRWHPFEYLLGYVDLCWYYRMSVLHLHFTDTQSYTLPSEAFPKLPSENRHYTREQIAYLNEYARARGIDIMPEIDVPGHSDPFAAAYPEIFGTSGIIGFDECVFKAFKLLFDELCSMFPYSRRIHIGGDEASIGNWLKNEKYRAYADSLGLIKGDERLDAERIYATFVKKLADIVRDNSRTAVVWEGFAKDVNYILPCDDYLNIMSWENFYQTTPDLISSGYTLINCSWNPLYIVAPDVHWTQKEVYDWNIYSFKPVHGGSPYIKTGLVVEPYQAMCGGQLLAWGDRLPESKEGLDNEFALIAERLPCVAQDTWNIDKTMDYAAFAEAFASLSKKTASFSISD